MIPVILEFTHRTMITARRIKMRRRTTRVGGPDASTAALAAVIAVSLFCLFTVPTLFSVQSLCSLCLCCEPFLRTTAETQRTQRSHRVYISVCQIAVVFFSFAFTFNHRRRCDSRSRRLPNQTSPFISFTQQL